MSGSQDTKSTEAILSPRQVVITWGDNSLTRSHEALRAALEDQKQQGWSTQDALTEVARKMVEAEARAEALRAERDRYLEALERIRLNLRTNRSGLVSATFLAGVVDAVLAAADIREEAMMDEGLPERVVVDANGAYWRDYGTHYSMCPTSDDNDPVVVAGVYVRAAVDTPEAT